MERRQTFGFCTCRGALFRLLAIAIGLTPLVIFELACVAFGWGEPDHHEDPFVGFASVRPLFVRDEAKGEYRIPEARYKFFYHESFPIRKRPRGLRVFCLGGSTVQGRPFSTETSFTTWLRLSLKAAMPDRVPEVVNCGGVSYASYRLIPVLEEILNYEPDLVIVYTGHNEFLEDRTYGHIKNRHALLTTSQAAISQLRTFSLLRTRYLETWFEAEKLASNRPILPRDVEARLDYRNGMEAYHRDPQWKRRVVAHYRHNIGRMIRLCDERRVPVLFVNPISNLRHTPPFKTEWDPTLPADELARCRGLVEQSREERRHDVAIRKLVAAATIDSGHAGIYYALAKRYDLQGRYEEAHRAYRLARDHDVCPLRILDSMHDALRDECRKLNVPLIDARARFESLSRDGIPGSGLLVDHVHPSIVGHQHIAELLMEHLIQHRAVAAETEWQARRDESYESHMSGLGDYYFVRGEERLRGLREWAAGNATLERATSRDGT